MIYYTNSEPEKTKHFLPSSFPCVGVWGEPQKIEMKWFCFGGTPSGARREWRDGVVVVRAESAHDFGAWEAREVSTK
ncbi:hypothetical protein MNBD_CPR01-370 [hydrothermal vent metagenome]|uniref:Uncharacterized protein n=1 Tax=hydrothermal vent metagenome TaxID=652676 RepID=A0A3B0UPZ4_9ZZZZ